MYIAPAVIVVDLITCVLDILLRNSREIYSTKITEDANKNNYEYRCELEKKTVKEGAVKSSRNFLVSLSNKNTKDDI